MKKFYFAALAAAAAFGSMPAQAVTFVPANGSAVSYLASLPGAQFTFETSAVPAGFTQQLTGAAAVRSFNDTSGAKPAFDDSTFYLTVPDAGSSATFKSTSTGYKVVSFYAGSIDDLNQLELLDLNGVTIATYAGTALAAEPSESGDQSSDRTNRLLTFIGQGSETFGGVRLTSGIKSFEVDNLRFTAAVPEPSTWLMLLVGFGFIGFTMRSRRRNTNVVYA